MIAQQLQPLLIEGEPSPDDDLIALARVLHAETRLLVELTETIRRQRAGVSRDDVAAVDDSVFGAYRVLRTLGEARRNRRSLVEQILGDVEVPLRDWPVAFGAWLTPELRDACDRAQQVAEVLAREIDINRSVLRRALTTSNDFVRVITGAPAQGLAYSPEPGGTVDTGRGRALLDREA